MPSVAYHSRSPGRSRRSVETDDGAAGSKRSCSTNSHVHEASPLSRYRPCNGWLVVCHFLAMTWASAMRPSSRLRL
jgi:hypothetical protein